MLYYIYEVLVVFEIVLRFIVMKLSKQLLKLAVSGKHFFVCVVSMQEKTMLLLKKEAFPT